MLKLNKQKKPLIIVLLLSGIFSSSISLDSLIHCIQLVVFTGVPHCGLPTIVCAQQRDLEWEGGNPRAVPASPISRATLLQMDSLQSVSTLVLSDCSLLLSLF